MSKLWLKHQKFMKGNAGFSLVELIIVIAIMAALIAILAPQYIKYVEKSRKAADGNTADEIFTACKVVAAEENMTSFEVTWDGSKITATGDSGALADVAANLGVTASESVYSIEGKASTLTPVYKVTYTAGTSVVASGGWWS